MLVEKLLDVEYRAWVDPSHPIADRGHATLRDLVDYPIVLPAGIELTSHRCAVKDLFVVEGLVPVYNSFFNMDKSAMFAVVPRDEQVALSFGYMERTFAKLGLAGVAVDTPHRASICVARSASGGETVGSAVDDIVRLISEAPGEPGDSLGISLDLFS